MANLSRLERLLQAIGEDNLPHPSIAPAAKPQEIEGNQRHLTKSQPTSSANEWWNAQPVTPKVAQPITSKQTHVSPQSNPLSGTPAPLGLRFSPFIAITKFPYKFVQKQWMQPIATLFFDQGKIWEREWDLYYIWTEHCPSPNPIAFIPEHQLNDLVAEINQAFPDANVVITDDLREDGLVLDFNEFTDNPDFRSRWLGRSTSKAQYQSWMDNLIMANSTPSAPPERSLQAFKEKIERAAEINKNKSKATRTKRQQEQVVKRQVMAQSLQRAQRYLGLLPPTDPTMPDIASLSPSPIDVDKPASHPFDQEVIFIAFDVELYERGPNFVTEIGVATLDTADLADLAPGRVGEAWQKVIRARHFRIAEYKHYRNKDFVEGCPDKFEFGTSEFISKDSIGTTLSSCFKPPFSGPAESERERNVILVGHDIRMDIQYLQSVGFNVLNSASVIGQIDTAELYRVYSRDPNARSLGGILLDHDLMGWHLHNAGNDAVYTLWGLLATCVQAASQRGTAEEALKHQSVMEKRMEVAAEQAREKVLLDGEGWVVGGSTTEEGQEKAKYYTPGGAALDV